VDPSGSYYPWHAAAIGKGYMQAKAFLAKRHSPEMELEDAIYIALQTHSPEMTILPLLRLTNRLCHGLQGNSLALALE
jgi:hypothetical protein